MIEVQGQELWRSGVKIGYVSKRHIFSHEGKDLGYSSGNYVYDADGRRLAYLQGDYICFNDSSRKIRIEDNEQSVVGGSFSNVENAAIRILLGE